MRRFALCLVIASILGATSGAGAAEAAFQGRNGLIAFACSGCLQSAPGYGSEIVLVRPDGSDLRYLRPEGYVPPSPPPIVAIGPVDHQPTESSPVWSADGRVVAFVHDQTLVLKEIWLVGSRSAGRSKVTNSGVRVPRTRDFAPAWFPDGSRIAFLRAPEFGDPRGRLYAARRDGRGLRPLSERPVWGSELALSPDGNWIAFSGGRVGLGNFRSSHARGRHGAADAPARGGGRTLWPGRVVAERNDARLRSVA